MKQIVALCLALLSMNTLFAEESWQSTHCEEGNCQIAFPMPPQKVKQSLKLSEKGDVLTYDIYLSPFQDRGVFLLLVATYPQPFNEGNEIMGLEGLLKGILSHNAHNQLIFAELVEFMGKPAMNFLVHSQASYFRGHAVMVGNKLYLMAMEGEKTQLEEKTFTRFIQSFQLLSK